MFCKCDYHSNQNLLSSDLCLEEWGATPEEANEGATTFSFLYIISARGDPDSNRLYDFFYTDSFSSTYKPLKKNKWGWVHSKLSTSWYDGNLWEEDHKWMRKLYQERDFVGEDGVCIILFEEKQRKCQPISKVHPKSKKQQQGLAKPTQCFLAQQSNDKPREGPAPRCTQLCHVRSGTHDDLVDRGSSRKDTYRHITATSVSVLVLRTPFQCRPVDSG